MSRRAPRAALVGLVLAVGCRATPERGDGAPHASGHLITLGEQVGDQPEIPVGNGIVDVNSVIHVRVDKAGVEKAVPSEWNAEFPPARLEALRQLSQATEAGQQGLAAMRRALVTWAASARDRAAVEALDQALRESSGGFVVMAEALEATPDLRERANAAFEALARDASQLEQDAIVLSLATELVQRERVAWQAFLEANGIFFQLGAWLLADGGSTPIHLPGFDDYPEQEYYEVERWSVRFDAQQQQEFESIAKTAKELNAQLVQPASYFRTYRDTLVSALKAALASCAQDLEAKWKELAKKVPADLAAQAGLPDFLERIAALTRKLRTLQAKYEGLDFQDPARVLAALDDLQADVLGLRDDLKGLVADAQRLIQALRGANLGNEVRAALDELASTPCLEDLRQGLVAFLKALGVDLEASRLNEELLEFTDQVLRHTLESLPESTEFDLHTSGRREAGDRVVLKFAVGRARSGEDGKPDPKPERRVLETRRLTLHRILPYLSTAVALIWANPTGSSALTRDYQAAASYSVLYKWGSRDSEAFNSLWSPGIGLNLSALDLDKDDNPELGVAAVVSLVRDYVQVGYGFDPSADTAYWFFGFSLPLTTWTLPGSTVDPGKP